MAGRTKMRSRRAPVVMLAALAMLLLAQPALASQVDPRNAEELPEQSKNAMPEHPQNVNARTGTISVTPNLVEAGDLVTATFHPLPGSVAWDIKAPKGASCKGGHVPLTAAQIGHIPLDGTGGPTSCTWRVGSTNRGWAQVEVGITGPCADLAAVHPGGAEFAACGSAHSDDYYMATGVNDPHIHGTVKDAKGRPIPGVAMDLSGDEPKQRTATDAIGHYGFWLKDGSYKLSPGKFVDGQQAVYGPDDFSPTEAHVSAHGTQQVDFTIKGHELGGKVTDSTGKPLAGVVLAVLGNTGRLTRTTAADGTYGFTLPGGRYAPTVISPAPPDPERNNHFLGAAYKCTGPGATKDGVSCIVQLSSDQSGVDFSVDMRLNVHIVIDGKDDYIGRHMVTITVTDTSGKPVGDQLIKISPQSIAGPRVILEGMDGGRIYPAYPSDVGSPPPTDDVVLKTDDSGKIQLAAWAGTQSGSWSLTAQAVDSKGKARETVPTEKAVAKIDLPNDGKPFPADDALRNGIVDALKAGIPHPASPIEGIKGLEPAAALSPVMAALAPKAKSIGVTLSPLHSADGRSAGVLLLERNPSDTLLKEVGAFLSTPGAPAPTGSNHVLDIGELVTGASKPGVSTWDQVTFSLKPTLADWPAAVAGAPRSRPVAGDPGSDADPKLNGFGWPDPPSAPIGILDRAAGREAKMFEVSRPRQSPVRLEFTDTKGARFGDVNGVTADVPGAKLATDGAGDMVRYVLPKRDYKVRIAGTGTGSAPVLVTSGRWNEDAKLFHVTPRSGTDGELDLGSNGSVGNMTYGGKPVPQTAGAALKVDGLPRSEPSGALREYAIKVTDDRGAAVPGATIKAEGYNYAASATSDASGRATLTLQGPTGGNLNTTVTAPAHAPVLAKIAPAKAELPPPSAAAREFVGPDQAVYIPRKPGSPLAVVELAATLFVSALGIGYLRTRPG